MRKQHEEMAEQSQVRRHQIRHHIDRARSGSGFCRVACCYRFIPHFHGGHGHQMLVGEICKNCANLGKTCCFDPRINPTMKEVDQLLVAGHKDFLVAYEYQNEGSWADRWDEAMVTEVDGKKYELCFSCGKDNACIFLAPGKGCTLNKFRPYICKVFPLWISRGTILIDTDFPACQLKTYSIMRIMQEIEESPRSLIHYCEEIIKDGLQRGADRRVLIEQLVREGKITKG